MNKQNPLNLNISNQSGEVVFLHIFQHLLPLLSKFAAVPNLFHSLPKSDSIQ
jgi:hypothetical protein